MGSGPDLDLTEVSARIRDLSAQLAAISDGRELATLVEELCNAGYGAALALDAEARRARRGIDAKADVDLELVRALDAIEVASRELRESLARLRTRVDWLASPAYADDC